MVVELYHVNEAVNDLYIRRLEKANRFVEYDDEGNFRREKRLQQQWSCRVTWNPVSEEVSREQIRGI